MRLLLYGLLLTTAVQAQEPLYDYVFFNNSPMPGYHLFSKTVFQSPSFIQNKEQQLPVNDRVFSTPGNSLVLDYVNGKGGNWQAIVYREELRGQDHFAKAKYLSFRVYNPSAQTTDDDFPQVQLMKRDSMLTTAVIFGIQHTINKWEQILVPVDLIDRVDPGKPEEIIGVVFSQQNNDGEKHTIYIDDIEFLPAQEFPAVTAKPGISRASGYARHVDIEWPLVTDAAVKYVKVYRAGNDENYYPVGIQSPSIHRYADYTGETGRQYSYKISFLDKSYRETALSAAVSAATRAMTDDELLTMVQEACFRYYWEGAESFSGLAKENIPGRDNMIAAGASGFGIMALVVGAERKFISRQQAVERFEKIVNFLEKAETFHGAFPHFIDGPTGKVEPYFGSRDNGGDLVETSFLLQGLLAAREFFSRNDEKEKMIRQKITRIWEGVEWDWYRRSADSKFLYWHWSPDQAWVINHKLIGWNETMVTYLLAIASPTHAVPASLYYSGWANPDSTGRLYRSDWGGTTEGSMYTNGNTYFGIKLDVGVSNGGPLFFTHYSYMGYDPHAITDKYTNYYRNNRNIALINYRYCVQNPGKFIGYGANCWGLSASLGPFYYSPDEPVLQRDRGKMTPTGALASFPYTPEESMKALKNYYYNYGKFLWGEYGFRDAFNLTQNWCSQIYMGLNQAPIVVMIENYRTGLIWKLFMSCPEVNTGLKKLRLESPHL